LFLGEKLRFARSLPVSGDVEALKPSTDEGVEEEFC